MNSWALKKLDQLFGIDSRSLGIFRISLAFLYLCDLMVRANNLVPLYTDYGVLPRISFLQTYQDPWIVSIHLMSGAAVVQGFLFLIAALAGMALLVGYRTQIASVLTWFMILSLDARNPLVLGEGVFIRVFLFWGMFLPLGVRYSVDSLLNPSKEETYNRTVSAATVAFLVQVTLIYFCAGWLKLKNQAWREGWAVFNSLAYDPLTKPLGYFLMPFKGIVAVLDYLVVAGELVGSALLFCPFFTVPLRIILVFGFILMQFGFALCLELGPLPWSMIIGMIPFLPSAFWDELTQSVSQVISTGQFRFSIKGFLKNGLVTVFLLYVLASNGTSFANYRLPYSIQRWGGSLLWMDQHWDMFSPPPRTGGWNVIEGRQRNGNSVDLLNHGRPVSWEKPKLVSATFKSQLWRKYWMRVLNTGFEIPREAYAQYFCRTWNAHRAEMEKLTEVEIFQMVTQTGPYQESAPQRVSFGKYSCT